MSNGRETIPRSGPGLSAPWLATRLGTQSARVEAMRREGQIFGVLPPGGRSYIYPAWQFEPDGTPRALVAELVAAARRSGLDERRLDEVLASRVGLRGEKTLVDLIREGDREHVLAAVRSAAAGRR